MADFSRLSNFNPDANFKLVRIGADSPVLEVELNEMQDISEQRYKDIVKTYIGDGINGEGNFNYSNGTLTITDEKAFIQGQSIEITTLNIPLAEGESAYLKVWEETIKTGDLIKYKGNQQEIRNVPNTLLDERVGRETSRRIQVKYDLVKDKSDENADYLYLGRVINDSFSVEASIKTIDSANILDRFISQGSQQIFTTSHNFLRTGNMLHVYIDGIYQIPEVNFTTLTNNSFKLTSPVEKGVEVVAVYPKSLVIKRSESHGENHHKGGSDQLDLSDLADNQGIVEKVLTYFDKVIDCGSFNDESTEIEEIYDGGDF